MVFSYWKMFCAFCMLFILSYNIESINCVKLRLVGDNGVFHEGRLLVKKKGLWTAICDQNWDIQTARVACRQLGFPSAERVIKGYEDGVKKSMM